MTNAITRAFLAALLPLGMTLSACSSEPETPKDQVASENGTLAEAIAANADLGTFAGAISDTGLGDILDGAGAYSVLAPDNAAFEALGESGAALMQQEQRPVLVGLLREHILPGHLTAESIGAAIDSGGGTASMTTLGGGQVTFRRDGGTITVSHSAGGEARLIDGAANAGNGATLPVDSVLARPQ